MDCSTEGRVSPVLQSGSDGFDACDASVILHCKKTLSQKKDSALIAALERCPYLVSQESPPSRYLEACGGDFNAAAVRLSSYWRQRNELFGESTYKPLTATGAGALNKSDREVLESGFLAQLPADSSGRIVLHYNRQRLDEDFDNLGPLIPSMLRCAYYVVSAGIQQVPTAKSAVLLYFCPSTFSTSAVDTRFTSGLRCLLSDAVPLNFGTIELVFKPPRCDREDYLRNVVPNTTTIVKENAATGVQVRVTVGNSKIQLIEALQLKGFEPNGIPVEAGGNWGYYHHFSNWRRMRAVAERIVEAKFSSNGSSAHAIIEEETAKQRKREKDVVYARRKRQKQKSKNDGLKQEIEQLKSHQDKLRADNEKLTECLQLAQALVSNGVASMTPANTGGGAASNGAAPLHSTNAGSAIGGMVHNALSADNGFRSQPILGGTRSAAETSHAPIPAVAAAQPAYNMGNPSIGANGNGTVQASPLQNLLINCIQQSLNPSQPTLNYGFPPAATPAAVSQPPPNNDILLQALQAQLYNGTAAQVQPPPNISQPQAPQPQVPHANSSLQELAQQLVSFLLTNQLPPKPPTPTSFQSNIQRTPLEGVLATLVQLLHAQNEINPAPPPVQFPQAAPDNILATTMQLLQSQTRTSHTSQPVSFPSSQGLPPAAIPGMAGFGPPAFSQSNSTQNSHPLISRVRFPQTQAPVAQPQAPVPQRQPPVPQLQVPVPQRQPTVPQQPVPRQVPVRQPPSPMTQAPMAPSQAQTTQAPAPVSHPALTMETLAAAQALVMQQKPGILDTSGMDGSRTSTNTSQPSHPVVTHGMPLTPVATTKTMADFLNDANQKARNSVGTREGTTVSTDSSSSSSESRSSRRRKSNQPSSQKVHGN